MNNRWYDRQNKLKNIVESLKNLDSGARHTFALDIIQATINKQSDKDNFLEVLDREAIERGRRWYDRSDMVRSAIEMLKYLPAFEVEELFKDTIISLIYEYDNENIPWE